MYVFFIAPMFWSMNFKQTHPYMREGSYGVDHELTSKAARTSSTKSSTDKRVSILFSYILSTLALIASVMTGVPARCGEVTTKFYTLWTNPSSCI